MYVLYRYSVHVGGAGQEDKDRGTHCHRGVADSQAGFSLCRTTTTTTTIIDDQEPLLLDPSMASKLCEPYGSTLPWAEPAWCALLLSCRRGNTMENGTTGKIQKGHN